MDISSSTSYNLLIGMVMKSSASLTIDTSLILQGETEDELPETVLGCGSLHKAEFHKAKVMQRDDDDIPATSD